MTPRDQQRYERPFEAVRLEQRRKEMTLEVIDAHVGQLPRERKCLRRRESNQQRPNETGPTSHGDTVEGGVQWIEGRLFERATNHGSDREQMSAPRKLGYDAAEGAMLVDRGLNDRRMNVKMFIDDRRGRLVTARFNT